MRSFAEKSADTSILEEMIRRLKVDEELTYEAMSTALGRDVREFCKGNLNSARRICERDGIVLASMPKVGYKRLGDTGIIDASNSHRLRIMRGAKRGINQLASVNFEALSDDHKRQHTAAAAQLGCIVHFSTSSARTKIESKVNGQQTLAIGETLGLFKGE